MISIIYLEIKHMKTTQRIGGGNGNTLYVVGLHPTGLQGLCLPSFKPLERGESQQQRQQWVNGWGSLHV